MKKNRPHFIIVGERRSGTTTLYDLLCKHTEISMLNISDFDFFIEPELFSRVSIDSTEIQDWASNHDISDYWKLFSNNGKLAGQKDADLLWWKPSHKRLAQFLPSTKFLVVLRNPVVRAESQYFNELSKGREVLSFQEAINREENSELSDWERLHLQYKERGCYAKSLSEFYNFIPENKVKVVILEELINNYEEEIMSICRFLEINEHELCMFNTIHSGKEKLLERKTFAKIFPLNNLFDFWERSVEAVIVRLTKNKSERDSYRNSLFGFYKFSKRQENIHLDNEKVKLYLQDYYREYNKSLESLIGRPLKYW